ncbi:hypothetical protein CVU82_04425 [Candidatus Falkowbacteria bacterium HGW-Falkowbacteria-1]|uniref:Uncharacterized protein n=1 Tax=Candidatus Falkowbacteria bacterium HGW-Falkowbacteria-1 TaxID=2013768 RepID=A0A2N2E8E3_9BACT|nr:MAG: hypothetical protein CVU82_04425 [Candidatus Falkowbacteria bacterium HGW-Falkowbacteria-1]
MFDNLQKKQDGIDDIFADTDSTPVGQSINQPLSQRDPIGSPMKAMDSKPKTDNNFDSDFDKEKRGSSILKKVFIIIFVLALVGVGAYFVYSQILLPNSVQNKDLTLNDANLNNQTNPVDTNNDSEIVLNDDEADIVDQDIVNEPGFQDDTIIDDQIKPEDLLKNVDSDGDGLSDYDEMYTYMTDLYNPDADTDGLSDYEEVMIFGSDPLSSDTDGDTYFDGEELMNGYSPIGTGAIDPTLFKNSDLFFDRFPNLVEKFNL